MQKNYGQQQEWLAGFKSIELTCCVLDHLYSTSLHFFSSSMPLWNFLYRFFCVFCVLGFVFHKMPNVLQNVLQDMHKNMCWILRRIRETKRWWWVGTIWSEVATVTDKFMYVFVCVCVRKGIISCDDRVLKSVWKPCKSCNWHACNNDYNYCV